MKSFATTEGLEIVDTFVEKQSAKKSGRSAFNEIMRRIGRGEARGILCWKLDRLARNPLDGGQITWLLQQGIIKVIRTNEREYLPDDNVILMSVEFGTANQYIIDLRANTLRGLIEKAKRGEYPRWRSAARLSQQHPYEKGRRQS